MESEEIFPSWKESVRNRPSMYIGDTLFSGFKMMFEFLFEELVEDCLENAIFEIEFHTKDKIVLNIKNIDNLKFRLRINELELDYYIIKSLGLGVISILSNNFSIQQMENNTLSISYEYDNSIFKDLDFSFQDFHNFIKQSKALSNVSKVIVIDKSIN